MNAKKLKKLRRKVKLLQVEWLKSLLNKEEAENINLKNIDSLLPKQTHYYGTGRLYLSYMTDKWIMKILKKYPDIETLGELNDINNKRQQLQRNSSLWMNTY